MSSARIGFLDVCNILCQIEDGGVGTVVAEEEVGGAEEDENRYHPVPVTEPHLALFEVRDYQGRFFTNLRKLR